MLAVQASHLAAHSPQYAHAHAVVRFDGKGCYRAVLSGEGATWCANKREHHNTAARLHGRVRAAAAAAAVTTRTCCWCRRLVKRRFDGVAPPSTRAAACRSNPTRPTCSPSATVRSSVHALAQLQRALAQKEGGPASFRAVVTAAAAGRRTPRGALRKKSSLSGQTT